MSTPAPAFAGSLVRYEGLGVLSVLTEVGFDPAAWVALNLGCVKDALKVPCDVNVVVDSVTVENTAVTGGTTVYTLRIRLACTSARHC